MYLRVEPKNLQHHSHKLASIAEDLYKVTKAENNTVVTDMTDLYVVYVSQSTFIPDTKPQLKNEDRKYLHGSPSIARKQIMEQKNTL